MYIYLMSTKKKEFPRNTFENLTFCLLVSFFFFVVSLLTLKFITKSISINLHLAIWGFKKIEVRRRGRQKETWQRINIHVNSSNLYPSSHSQPFFYIKIIHLENLHKFLTTKKRWCWSCQLVLWKLERSFEANSTGKIWYGIDTAWFNTGTELYLI